MGAIDNHYDTYYHSFVTDAGNHIPHRVFLTGQLSDIRTDTKYHELSPSTTAWCGCKHLLSILPSQLRRCEIQATYRMPVEDASQTNLPKSKESRKPMTKSLGQLTPNTNPLLATAFLLLTSVLLLFLVACGGDEASTSDNTAASNRSVAPTVQPTAVPQAIPTPAATQVPTATPAPEPAGVTINNCGVKTVYEVVPQRVVATDTSALEVLMALGLQDHVIGYFGGTPDRLQPQHQARAALVERLGGSFPYPSLEAVLAPGPDLVFSYGFNESTGFTGQGLRDAEVHSFSFTEACPDFTSNVTLDVMFEDVRALALIFDVEDRGEELIAMWEQQIAEVSAAIPAGEPVRVFYFDSGEEAPFTALAGSVMSDIISRAGGINILSDVSGTWGTVEWEAVVDGDPELIIFVDYGFGGPDANQAFLESNPSLSGMSAVVNGQYMTLTFLQSVPGPQNLDGLIEVATAVRRVNAAR